MADLRDPGPDRGEDGGVPMGARVTLIVEFHIQQGRLDAFRSAGAALRAAVEEWEPGVLAYDWWLSDDATRGLNIETFADSAALATHMRSHAPLVADLIATVSVERLRVLGPLTPDGRAAIEAAATGYYSLLGGIDRPEKRTAQALGS